MLTRNDDVKTNRSRPENDDADRFLPLAAAIDRPVGRAVRALAGCWPVLALAAAPTAARMVLAVHGGTGMAKADLTPEMEKQLRAELSAALDAGYRVLGQSDGTSVDAVEAAIKVLEDSPLFNAGRGAVFTAEGRNELDASIMMGQGRKAGAVAGVTNVKNPIRAARAVMDKSPHVLLIGRGAESFAAEAGWKSSTRTTFGPSRAGTNCKSFCGTRKPSNRRQQRPAGGGESQESPNSPKPLGPVHEWGTVGAVALDRGGNWRPAPRPAA